jgi:hypothetical protein
MFLFYRLGRRSSALRSYFYNTLVSGERERQSRTPGLLVQASFQGVMQAFSGHYYFFELFSFYSFHSKQGSTTKKIRIIFQCLILCFLGRRVKKKDSSLENETFCP